MQESAKRANKIEIWFQIRSLPLYPTELQARRLSLPQVPDSEKSKVSVQLSRQLELILRRLRMVIRVLD